MAGHLDNWPPPLPFIRPDEIACVTMYDRIKAIAPYDLDWGDPVYVEPGTGVPAKTGLLAAGCTWESVVMAGSLAVIQINTRKWLP